MKRSSRQDEIIDIIRTQEISTQEELTDALKERGYTTTQATVSRDIKELGLVKIAGMNKKFKYAVELPRFSVGNKMANIFKESVVSIDYSLNLIVVKTVEGSANGAANFLDKANIPGILGTISGDDTILIVAKNIADVAPVMAKLKEYLV